VPINRRLDLPLSASCTRLCVTRWPTKPRCSSRATTPPPGDRARDQARLDKEFNLDESRRHRPGVDLWHFTPKDAGFNDNLPAQAVLAAIQRDPRAREERGVGPHPRREGRRRGRGRVDAQTVHLDAGADWQWVEFPAEKWVVASWSKDPTGKWTCRSSTSR